MFSLGLSPSPAFAQAPANNPNEMCGDGTTFTVNLPAKVDLGGGLFIDTSNNLTLPHGCRIYALLVSEYGRNASLNELGYYNLAKFIAENNGYVHYAWWNNLLKEYMAGPLHTVTLGSSSECLPGGELFGVTIPPLCGPTNVAGKPGIVDDFYDPNGLEGFLFVSRFIVQSYEANPYPLDDQQFRTDAEAFLKAIRQDNPDALIIVVSSGPAADTLVQMFRETTTPNVDVDLLALIDPTGILAPGTCGNLVRDAYNVNCPYPWLQAYTHWSSGYRFRGFKRRDCVRNSIGLCKDFDPNPFRVQFQCRSVGDWIDHMPAVKSFAPVSCPGPEIDTGQAMILDRNIKNLYHRWQGETGQPYDYELWNSYPVPSQCNLPGCRPPFPVFFKAGFSFSTSTILSGKVGDANFQHSVVGSNIDTCSDPNKADPRDPSLKCSPLDGHEELLGFRGVEEPAFDQFGVQIGTQTRRVPKGVAAQNWPSDAAGRRAKLIEMATPDPTGSWPQRPQNPDLCLVCGELIATVQNLLSQQPGPSPTEDMMAPVTSASLTPQPNGLGWNNDDTLLQLNATDETGGSGVKEVEYAMDGAQVGGSTVAGSAAQATITAEGVTTVSFFASDNAGNSETPKTLEVKIDKTPPEIAALTDVDPNANGWNNTSVLVSFPASDEAGGSGLATSSADVAVSTEGAGQEITGTAEDNAGNQSTAVATLNIDKTSPSIILASRTPAANAADWNNTDVAFTWDCSDALSGPVAPSVMQAVTGEGAGQSVTGTCTDLADNTASDTQSGINIDKTDPAINITTPAEGAAYLLNAAVNADYACTDNLSGVKSCTGPVANGAAINTSTVGDKQFIVNSSDVAGNGASSERNYTVQYAFSGFTNPIAPMPTENVAKAGRTLPVKYSLLDANGTFVSDLSSFVSLLSAPVACDATAPGVLAADTDAAGSTTIRYDATSNQFIYNWKTDNSWAGSCRMLQLTLNDDTQHLVMFRFQ